MKIRTCVLLPVLIVLGGMSTVIGQDLSQGRVDFSQEGDDVVVTYDLLGEEGEEYEVTLLLSTSGGESYDYEPQAVSGDVGSGISPGSDKQIRWRVLEDFPDGLQSPNVQFKVVIEEEGGNRWLYVLGGSVLAGGGGTAVAVLTGLVGGSGNGGGGSDNGGGDNIPPLDLNPPD